MKFTGGTHWLPNILFVESFVDMKILCRFNLHIELTINKAMIALSLGLTIHVLLKGYTDRSLVRPSIEICPYES